MKKLGFAVSAIGVGVLAWISVYADISRQEIPSIQNAVDPGLITKRLQGPVDNFPTATTVPRKPALSETKTNPVEEKIKFKLVHVTFKGNTAFKTYELEAIFKPFYNKTISLAVFKDLVNQISKKYRSAGYILSRAILPPQTIKQGEVQIQIIEGRISVVTVSGNPGWVDRVIKKYSQPIIKSHPLQIQTLERSLLLMNDLPGASVKAVITPSDTVPAAADLDLVTQQKKIGAYLSYDNYGTRYIGPQEIGLGVVLNSVTLPGASDTVRLMTVAQTSEMEYIEYTHTNPLGSNGAKLTIGGNYANTQPEFVLSGFDVVGRSKLVYADISYPVLRSRAGNFYIHSTANYQNVSSTILGFPFYADFIRSLVIGGEYNAIDHWRGVTRF